MTDPRFDLGTDQLAMTPTLAARIATALPEIPPQQGSPSSWTRRISDAGVNDLALWARAMQLPGVDT